MPIAGCPSCTALATNSSSRDAPSSIENSVWTWRCVKESAMKMLSLLSSSYSVVILEPTRCSRRLLEVGAGTLGLLARDDWSASERTLLLAHLSLRHGLLHHHRGLDSMEQPFEPADELGLGDA